MMGFIFLSDKVGEEAVEGVGQGVVEIVVGGNPTTEAAAETIVQQNIVLSTAGTRRHGC